MMSHDRQMPSHTDARGVLGSRPGGTAELPEQGAA